MLIHTLNLTSSDVEFAKFPGRELLVPRLKGEERGGNGRTKGRREGREGARGNGREGRGRRGNEGGEREEEVGVKFCSCALGGWTPLHIERHAVDLLNVYIVK